MILLAAGCSKQDPIQAKQETGPVPVRVAPVVQKKTTRVVESVGTLFSYDEAIISAEIDGRIEQIAVDMGDRVQAGQVLVRISDEEQRYLLAQNEAQLRQSLERLGLQSDKERVKDVNDTPDVRRARADLFDAEQRYKRVRNLVDSGIGSRQDLDQAQARFQAAQAALDSSVNQTRNLIQEVERFKAQLELQRKKLRDATVKAPFAGSVKDRQATIGQYVRANTPLVTLVKTDPLRLRLEVPERFAAWIQTGLVADVTIESFADKVFKGKVWRLSPTVDQQKRTFIVEALIDNPNNLLKPGSYARAKMPTQRVEEVLVVPQRAVNYTLGSNKAYVVANGVVEAREVKLGDRFEGAIEIIEGVKPGEEVAVTNLARLDTGSRVRIETGAPKKDNPRPAE